MSNLHFTSALLFSVLSFTVACSSDKTTPSGGVDGSASGGSTATGGATSSGGSTATGGAASSGGSKADSGTADAGTSPCETYCKEEDKYCTGLNVQFTTNDECLTTCATYASGTAGDPSGDTLACRLTHLGFIISATDQASYATLHCPHTGAKPTLFCVSTTPADAGRDAK